MDENTGETCMGCLCEVPVRDGKHEEPVYDDQGAEIAGTVYVYPCTAPARGPSA